MILSLAPKLPTNGLVAHKKTTTPSPHRCKAEFRPRGDEFSQGPTVPPQKYRWCHPSHHVSLTILLPPPHAKLAPLRLVCHTEVGVPALRIAPCRLTRRWKFLSSHHRPNNGPPRGGAITLHKIVQTMIGYYSTSLQGVERLYRTLASSSDLSRRHCK